MKRFIGRKEELEQLSRLLEKGSASLVVIRGRRRVGKTTLMQHFGQQHRLQTVILTGLPLTRKTTAQSQREEFARQLCRQFNYPPIASDDWSDLFNHLGRLVQGKQILVLMDEISWMGSKDADFLGKLKIAWDNELKMNPGLILVLCGSVSSWIEENILSSTGFLGRWSRQYDLQPLSLSDCYHFWDGAPGIISAYEIFKVLAITGGIPRYLEEILPHRSAEENIRMLCFEPGGFLVEEFDRIFTDALLHRSHNYRLIVRKLSEGPLDADALAEALNQQRGGTFTKYLLDLELAGFISKDWTWDLKTAHKSKLSHFRLRDNYSRFYLKYIEPYQSSIRNGDFKELALASLPAINSVLGLQFENLVISNKHLLYRFLGLRSSEVLASGPFFQRMTKRCKGCQIDLLIQTEYGTLYPVEIKFSKNPIGSSAIGEMQRKIHALSLPRHMSLRPVLVHVNGVTEELMSSRAFAHIVDFSSLIKE